MIISLWSAKNSTLPTELLWVKFKGSVFENVEFVFEISPQKPLIWMLKHTWEHSNLSDHSLGSLSFTLYCVPMRDQKNFNCYQWVQLIPQRNPTQSKTLPSELLRDMGRRNQKWLQYRAEAQGKCTGSTSDSLFLLAFKSELEREAPEYSSQSLPER